MRIRIKDSNISETSIPVKTDTDKSETVPSDGVKISVKATPTKTPTAPHKEASETEPTTQKAVQPTVISQRQKRIKKMRHHPKTKVKPPKRKTRQSKKLAVTLSAILVIALLAGGGYSLLKHNGSNSSLPSHIRAEIPFSPFVIPEDSAHLTATNYKLNTAEDSVQILSYVIRDKEDLAVSVSEYVQPPEFTEIPEYKERFLNNVVQKYETVQTANGTVHLGRLKRQDDKQLGLMIERGLLVFMSPETELEPAEWRNLVDQLEIQKVIN